MVEPVEAMVISINILTSAIVVLVVAGVQSTSASQTFYPGIIVYFDCIVPTPFIQVDGIDRTSERGTEGYIEDLSAMGIEVQGVSSQNSFIPTVCVNGSSSELRQFDTLTITITCQEIQLDRDFQPFYIQHFTFSLTYQSEL